jgi:uncharacterized repeat protein (TIGR01451 family)
MTLGKTASASVAHVQDRLVYTLSVILTGSPSAGAVVTDTLPAGETFQSPGPSPPGTTFQISGSLLTWTLPLLVPGTYDLTYSATVDNTLLPGQTLLNTAWLTYPAGSPVTAQALVNVIGAYTVKVGVYNEAGELIATLNTFQANQPVNDFSLGPATLTSLHSQAEVLYQGVTIATWNGKTQDGNPATNGTYHVSVESIDATGEVTTVTRQVNINRNLEKITVSVYNEAGELVRQLYHYVDDPGGETVNGMTLSSSLLIPGSTVPGVPNQVTVTTDQGTVLGSWDGRTDSGALVTSGQYFIEIHSVDGISGSTTITKRVTVLESGSNWERGLVQARPNRLTSASPLATFFAADTNPLTLRVRLYDMAGEMVGQATPGPAGTNTAIWDSTVCASGLYIAVVELYESDGTFAGRQRLKLIVVH